MKLYRTPHNVHITSNKKSTKKTQEQLRKKAIQEGKEQRLKDGEKDDNRKAGTKESIYLFVKEKKVMKTEKQKDSKLQTAKTLYEKQMKDLLKQLRARTSMKQVWLKRF